MIIINFEITQHGYTLRDALVLPDDHTFTDEQLEEMKQQRFDNWYTIITTPHENPNPELPPENVTSDIIDVPPTDITSI